MLMGSAAKTAEETVDYLRARGEKVALAGFVSFVQPLVGWSKCPPKMHFLGKKTCPSKETERDSVEKDSISRT